MTPIQLMALVNRLAELKSLPYGWDGYQGTPVNDDCIWFAIRFFNELGWENFPMPSLVPGSDGTLQVQWDRGGFNVEVDILGSNEAFYTIRNTNNGNYEEGVIDGGFNIVKYFIKNI